VAAKRGVLPREMQSITWEEVPGLFGPQLKSQAKNVAAVSAVWENFKSGKIDVNEARMQLLAIGGGITDPSWVQSPAGDNEGARDA
jgi:hypothetical protein